MVRQAKASRNERLTDDGRNAWGIIALSWMKVVCRAGGHYGQVTGEDGVQSE